MKFSLRQLEAFQATANSGSVTQAAKRLGVSQPAVSRLLADFANTVGFELFERESGTLTPTSEARYMLTEVSRVFESLNHLEDLRRDLKERTAGHLRIACLPGFATSHLPKVLTEFLDQRPGVTVTLEPDRPERILEWIIGQQYDCGITDGFSGHPATETIDIPIKTACILPEDHPLAAKDVIAVQDLRDEKIIHSRRDSPFHAALMHCFDQKGVPLNSWIEVRQFTAACTLVSQGYGASIVSALDAAQFEGRGLVSRPFEPDLSHELSILRPITGAQPLLVLDFIETFVESLQPFVHESQKAIA
ncbi:LysR substrate-binding domain-containing protein [Maritalea mediterranea]|uniref:LysR substrate-binding domain-containing protein n=1 Tax=Maritalea mediterranea TaxID=2909667 RepID=A0ABS9EBM1_9HYPH|nr:LysR substrate-binding domain-containing protein [Maritalea mediterranea]MCF4099299.1 LysR substrate-binding domain-containing protein [Maritalea mediterranea]